MANQKKRRTLASAGVSLETLEQTTQRALEMLVALGTSPGPFTLMSARGYDAAEHRRGWALVQKLIGDPAEERREKSAGALAVAELDNWDESGLKLVAAGLTRHPEVRARVLAGLAPVAGPGAVVNVAALLERLDAEEATDEGRAALETLARRGVDAAERRRLAGLVRDAKRAAEALPPDLRDGPEYVETLLALRDWYTEWSEIARLTIKRRDYLIRMGLAERRTGSGAGAGPGVDDPTPFLDPRGDAPGGPADPTRPGG
jgi:hypothetical protein